MGWYSDEQPLEGWLVAVVREPARKKHSTAPRAFYLRELSSWAGDEEPRADVEWVQGGCECGWRSPRLRLRAGRAEWQPFILVLHDSLGVVSDGRTATQVESDLRGRWMRHNCAGRGL